MFKRKSGNDLTGGDKAQRTAGSNDDRKVSFVKTLSALNEQFAAWVKEQASEHATELWTDGVEDYLSHAKKLLQDYKDVLASSSGEEAAKPAATAPPAAGFAWGSLPTGKPPLAPFLGGSSGQTAAPTFAALPSTGGGFNFSAAPAATGMFKVPSVPSTGTLGSLGGSGTTLGGATTAEEDDAGEEQQPDEPSVQLEPSDAEILVKQRIKLMSLVEEGAQKKWKDKGAGTLTLRRAKGEGTEGRMPYLVFTTDSGRVLINAPLVRGMKPTTNPKTPANLAMFLVSSVEGQEQRGMHLFKFGDAAAAKEVHEKVLEFM